MRRTRSTSLGDIDLRFTSQTDRRHHATTTTPPIRPAAFHNRRLPLVAGLIGASLASAAGPAAASENGQIEYPIGVNTVLSAVRPPPGETRYYNYLQGYQAGETDNAAGKSTVPNFDLRAVVNAARTMHTWGWTEHGFSFTSVVVVPFVEERVIAGPRNKQIFGIGDVNVQQYINWNDSKRTLYLSAGLTSWFPTGRYRSTRLANTGLNRYTLAPELDATWIPSPHWEATATTVFEQNFTNPATHYLSGHDITTDFSLMYAASKFQRLHFGLDGYVYKQIDDDRQNGRALAATDRAQVAALGPQARLDFGRAGVVFKVQHEFAAQLRPQGNRFWVQFTVPLSPQTQSTPPHTPPPET
jgi:hypothetical protein